MSTGELTEDCASCRVWRPHHLYPQIGFCPKTSAVTCSQTPACKLADQEIVASEFYWCATCETQTHVSELAEHNGHHLYLEPYTDPDFCEDAVSGD